MISGSVRAFFVELNMRLEEPRDLRIVAGLSSAHGWCRERDDQECQNRQDGLPAPPERTRPGLD